MNQEEAYENNQKVIKSMIIKILIITIIIIIIIIVIIILGWRPAGNSRVSWAGALQSWLTTFLEMCLDKNAGVALYHHYPQNE